MNRRKLMYVAGVLFFAAAAILFTACPMDGGTNSGTKGGKDESETELSEDGKTYVLFKNTGPWNVDIFSDPGRTSRVAAVPAGGDSRLEWIASPDGSSFYLTYHAPVGDGITVPYNPFPIGPYRIDEGKIIPISIESPPPSSEPLTDKVCLLLYNEGNSGFRLVGRGGSIYTPEKIFGADTGRFRVTQTS
jgi:hypothetical protein